MFIEAQLFKAAEYRVRGKEQRGMGITERGWGSMNMDGDGDR